MVEMVLDIGVGLAVGIIGWWLLIAPLRWSPFRDVRERAREREVRDE